MRGYFDGDGSIYCDKNGKNYAICIASTIDFCNSIDIMIDVDTLIYLPNSAKNNNTSTRILKIKHVNDLMTFLDWIYKDATIYLNRKFQKYKEYKILKGIL